MTTTNGFPTRPPIDLPPVVPKRRLVVEVYEDNVVLDTEEPTRDDVIAWMSASGIGHDMLDAEESAKLAEVLAQPPRAIPALRALFDKHSAEIRDYDPSPEELASAADAKGEPVRLTGPDRAKFESEPSGNSGGLGKMPSDPNWLRSAVADAREQLYGPSNARTTGDIALETVGALVHVLEAERLGRAP